MNGSLINIISPGPKVNAHETFPSGNNPTGNMSGRADHISDVKAGLFPSLLGESAGEKAQPEGEPADNGKMDSEASDDAEKTTEELPDFLAASPSSPSMTGKEMDGNEEMMLESPEISREGAEEASLYPMEVTGGGGSNSEFEPYSSVNGEGAATLPIYGYEGWEFAEQSRQAPDAADMGGNVQGMEASLFSSDEFKLRTGITAMQREESGFLERPVNLTDEAASGGDASANAARKNISDALFERVESALSDAKSGLISGSRNITDSSAGEAAPFLPQLQELKEKFIFQGEGNASKVIKGIRAEIGVSGGDQGFSPDTGGQNAAGGSGLGAGGFHVNSSKTQGFVEAFDLKLGSQTLDSKESALSSDSSDGMAERSAIRVMETMPLSKAESPINHLFSADNPDGGETHIQRAVVNQVAAGILPVIGKGKHSIKLKLHPESLGALEMEVSLKNKAITTHLIAQTSDAKALIESNLHHLRETLNQHGLHLEQFSISLGKEQQWSGSRSTHSNYPDDADGSEDGNSTKPEHKEEYWALGSNNAQGSWSIEVVV